MAKSSRDQIEQDEKKLLYELMKNAKENIDTIAKHCGFSRQKTSRLMKQLETKKLIWGYTAIINEQQIGLTHFTLLIQRNMKPLKEETADRIISRKGEDILNKMGGSIESSASVHGEYDWISTFMAKDIKQAKQYVDTIVGQHSAEIEKITLLQTLMFVKKQNILNPDRKKLKDFL